MNTTPITVKDRVLHVVKRLVPKGNQSGHRWPSSCRVLHKRVDQHADNFWDNVTKTHTIDLSAFNLPGCTRVQFVHIDPVYVWITRCNALIKHGVRIHWDPQKLYHPQTNARLYGGGIQYGNLLQAAHVSRSGTGKVALFNINWDGGLAGFGSRSCTPVQVQVMNANSSSALAVGLVGYLPYISVPAGFRSDKDFIAARHHVLQVKHTHIPPLV